MPEDDSYAQSKRVPATTDLVEIFPYARVVRIGKIVEIAGTGAYDEAGNLVGAGDVYEQAKCIYAIIEKALAAVGATMTDVAKVTVLRRILRAGRRLPGPIARIFAKSRRP